MGRIYLSLCSFITFLLIIYYFFFLLLDYNLADVLLCFCFESFDRLIEVVMDMGPQENPNYIMYSMISPTNIFLILYCFWLAERKPNMNTDIFFSLVKVNNIFKMLIPT